MTQILRDNPLLLLFLVAGIGYPVGRLRFGEVHLGMAAVLFVRSLTTITSALTAAAAAITRCRSSAVNRSHG